MSAPSGGEVSAGLRWSAASQFGRQAMQTLTLLVLARYLAPADFGLVAMATVVTGFLYLFRDLGTSSAVIQRKETDRRLLSSVLWLNAGFGVLASLVVAALAYPMALFYGEPRLVPVLQALGATFAIAGAGILHQALLTRELRFGVIGRIEIGSVVLGGVVGVAAAVAGLGVWSLVLQALVVTALTSAGFWAASRFRPAWTFSVPDVRELLGYSLNVTGYNVFNYVARNADAIIIGRFLGAASLGVYTLAYTLMLLPIRTVSGVISRVMFPVYSRLQDDAARVRAMFLRSESAIAFVTFPLMLGLVAVASPFVQTFFGPEWSDAVLLIAILAPVGILQSVVSPVAPLYLSTGRADLMFRVGVAAGVGAILAFFVGIPWGIVGVTVAYAVATAVLAYPNLAVPFRLVGLRFRDALRAVWPALACSLLMLAVVLAAQALLLRGLPPALVLAASVTLGAATYLVASWLANRAQFKTLLRVAGLSRQGGA